MNVAQMYRQQVKPEKVDGKYINTRAEKEVRYYNFEQDKIFSTLEEKEQRSIELLAMALLRSKKPVVSCSFGIDSIITIFLTRKALEMIGRDPSDVDIVWNDTLNEFPAVRKYAKELTEKWNLRLKVYKPEKPLKKIIDDNGGITSDYFTARKGDRKNGQPLSEKCCGTLKHKPMKKAIKENKWDLVINGLRADESTQRLRAGLRDGEYFYSISEWKSYVCRPILWIKEEEIWDIVEKNNIPYNDLYDQNIIRTDNNRLSDTLLFKEEFEKYGIDTKAFVNGTQLNFTKKQSFFLKSLGYKMFTPRTGCQMCPIPVKYGYLQFMRLNYPKVYNAMIHKLGYGKGLISIVPEDVKREIKEMTGYDLTVDQAVEHLQEILEAKPCTFDFNE